MTTAAPAPEDVLAKVDALGPPGTPVTTPEVAEGFDCTKRTIYNRLEALVEEGPLLTKKVGANSRVWWRPVDGDVQRNGGASDERGPAFLRDGQALSSTADGEMAERIREFEWAETPLGPIEEWPAELRVAVDIMLGTSEAIGIYWGDDLTLLYNDAAREQIGRKHPDALGQPAREVFPEAWETLGPMHEQVMAGKGPVHVEEKYLPLERGEELEDAWFDSSFNPIPCADGSVGGVLNVSVEVTDRVRAESDLRERQRESERRYRTVLNSMDEGFFLADVVFDRDGEPLDILYRDSNPAAIEMTGEEFEGRWLTEIDMGYEEYWYEVFGRVASTGEGERHELYADPDGIWYDFYVFKPEGAGSRRVAVVFKDVTERKEAERALQQRADLDAFRVDLTDAIRTLSDPVEIQQAATRVLGERLGVDRAHYGEVLADGTTNRIHADYCREGVESVVGEHDFADYGDYIADTLQAGETLVLDDLSSQPDLSDEERAAHRRFDIEAYVSVPLVKDGQLTAYCGVTQDTPRDWTDTEIAMVEETAERTWAAVERAHAEQELRETREQLEIALDVEEMGVWELDLQTRESPYRSPRHDEIFGYDDPVENWSLERALDHVHPDDREMVRKRFDAAIESGNWEFESRIIRDDGEQRWIRARGTFFYEDETPIRGVGTVQDITERKEAEEQLRKSEERQRFLVELNDAIRPLTDAVSVQRTAMKQLAEHLDVTRASYFEYDATQDTFTQAAGYETEDTIELPERMRGSDFVSEIMAEYRAGRTVAVADTETDLQLELAREAHRAIGVRAWVGVPLVKNGQLVVVLGVHNSTPRNWTDSEVRLIEEVAERTWAAVERARAEQELKASNQSLERLNAATREFLDSGPETITDRVAGLVREVLDVEYAALWRYDDQRGDLEEHAVDTAPDVDLGALSPSTEFSELVWQTFVGSDVDVLTDVDGQDDTWGPLESRVLVPLGRHGVVCLGSTRAGAFDDGTVDLVEMVAATVETAWDRAAGEAELADRNDELARLDRLNTLIREIDKALVAADTREEIDDAVCDRLADSDLYEFAWIGEHDLGTNSIEPRAWAGVDSGYLEDLEVTVEDTPTNRDPIARAVRTGELQVVADIATNSGFAPWREATLERGARSLVCIPLVYDDTVYGVLTVYAGRPQSEGDERNHEVLSELGHTIAHTINARETRATLQTDSVVELTLRFDDADAPLCRLARVTDCTVEYQGFVPRSSGHADVFFIARAVNPEELQATAEKLLAVESVHCLTEREDESLFRVRVSDPTLAARFTDAGAVVRSITIDAGVATAVVDIPHTAAVRSFLDQLRQWNPDFELLARQSRERPLKTRQTFAAALDDYLTDRQREVLQTAYLSGFFEVPRISNGKEVTELLGVSQPTFSEHLRAAQRRLCEVLFESGSPADVSESDEALP